MAKKKKSQWRLRQEWYLADDLTPFKGEWSAGLEVEATEIDWGCSKTFYHITFRYSQSGFASDLLVVKTKTTTIPANLLRGEWACNTQARALLRTMLPLLGPAAKKEYDQIVIDSPDAAVV